MSEHVQPSVDHLDEMTAAFEKLAATFEQTDDLEPVLQAVCVQVMRVVSGADLASITLVRDGVPETVASTDLRAARIDAAQYEEEDGPCVRAARTGDTVRVEVETAARLWPHFTAVACDAGVASYLASPLRVDAGMAGAVNLFGFGAHGFRELDEKYLDLYTVAVETIMRIARRYLVVREQVGQLRAAMVSRAVIEQAKGILMAARGLNENDAFQVLVMRSQDENIKLHTVAARFVSEASRPQR
jgi:GAF domain-containing protein